MHHITTILPDELDGVGFMMTDQSDASLLCPVGHRKMRSITAARLMVPVKSLVLIIGSISPGRCPLDCYWQAKEKADPLLLTAAHSLPRNWQKAFRGFSCLYFSPCCSIGTISNPHTSPRLFLHLSHPHTYSLPVPSGFFLPLFYFHLQPFHMPKLCSVITAWSNRKKSHGRNAYYYWCNPVKS